MASSFLERLRSGPPICADGGMGTLIASAVPRLRCPEEANLRSPQSVVDLHLGFIRAGAELIETNTFGANRRKLARHFLEQELEQINSAGVKLARDAREVSGRTVYIAGSIGPLGDVGDAEDERFGAFAEQAAVLEGRGVDLFMVETFYDLAELEQAIEAVRSVSSLPIVALLTFDEDAETLAGVAARAAADRLRSSTWRRWARTTVRASRRRWWLSSRWAGTARHWPCCRISALPASRAAGSSSRTPRPSTSPSSPPRREPRRGDHRRLLRDDADRDRRHSRSARRGADAVGAARGRGADAGGCRACARP